MSCFLGKIHLRGRPEETRRPIKSMAEQKVRLKNLSSFNPCITVQLWRPKCSYAPRICICLYISDAEHPRSDPRHRGGPINYDQPLATTS